MLAIEQHADLRLVDERRGRRMAAVPASRSPVSSAGSPHAKRAGLIDKGRLLLDQLIGSARFWISPGLYREVLIQLGES